MENMVWAVDGSFFGQRISGIQRYSIELLSALDALVPPGLVEIVAPPGVRVPVYENIKSVTFGTRTGLKWQQLAEISGRQGAGHLQRDSGVRIPRNCRCS